MQENKPQEVPEQKDNLEEFGIKVTSPEEQKKIMAQIIQEEQYAEEPIKEEEAVYIEDDSDKCLEIYLNLSKQNSQTRLAYIKHLAERMSLINGYKHLTQIKEEIFKDSDEMKKILIQQLNILWQNIRDKPEGLQNIKDHVIPCYLQLIKYKNFDIQKDACEGFAELAAVLTPEERQDFILKDVIILSHDEESEDNKIIALELFGLFANILGREQSESFILHELVSGADDQKWKVRREAVSQIPRVGRVVRQEIFISKLFPIFLAKSEDKQWQVRRACADIIVELAEIVPAQIKDKALVQKMQQFIKDPNKWVKASAFMNLGKFISKFTDQPPSDALLTEFCRITNKDIHEYFDSEEQLLIISSSYFPAVLKVYGKIKWPQLAKLFDQLYKYNLKDVRRPLASALHEIAIIIGPDNSEKELIKVLDQLLKETMDEVKYAATKNLWQFIKVFKEESRENLIDVFVIIQKDQKKWRIRQLIANQLQQIVQLYQTDTIFQIIVPITLKLCNDIVSVVRKKASKQIHFVLNSFLKNDEYSKTYYQCFVENIKAFAISNRYNQRQAFAYMCQNLMLSPSFEELFLQNLIDLSQDKVRNVRFSVAEVVSKHIKKNRLYSKHHAILDIVERFKTDPVLEIRKLVI
ncbi:hypothetical protein pb186bvf_001009 [Paramecium bursaria]